MSSIVGRGHSLPREASEPEEASAGCYRYRYRERRGADEVSPGSRGRSAAPGRSRAATGALLPGGDWFAG